MSDKNTTHFGYKTVNTDEKQGMVAGVFHSVAAKYDIMNDLMSAGVHRIWKRFTIELSGVRPGHQVLDIAGGTGVFRRYRPPSDIGNPAVKRVPTPISELTSMSPA